MNNKNIFRNVNMKLDEEDILMLSPLQLAYIGDAVYELIVRTYILDNNLSVNKLHRESTKYVSADAQARAVHLLEDFLTDKEIRMVKRGRNTKTNTNPKNMDIVDYKYATGFETLLGYLYMNNKFDRIFELFNLIVEDNREEDL